MQRRPITFSPSARETCDDCLFNGSFDHVNIKLSIIFVEIAIEFVSQLSD